MSLKRFAASVVLAIGLVPAAHAGNEIYLRWDDCHGDGGNYNKTFACDTNSGGVVLVGSFRLDQALEQVTALEGDVEVIPLSGETLPSWWQYSYAGSCRQTSLSVSFIPSVPSSACPDVWNGLGPLGGSGYSNQGGNRGILKMVEAPPAGSVLTLPAGQELFAFQVRIDNARTVGPAACGGCNAPVCIDFAQMRVHLGPTVVLFIPGRDTPNNGWNVTWQPGAVPTVDPYDGFLDCQSVTPTRHPTWGSIHSLYRR